MFKRILLIVLGISVLTLSSYNAAQSAELLLVDGKAAVREHDGIHMLPTDEFPVEQAQNAPMRFISVSTDHGSSIRSGVYLFDEQGNSAGFIDTSEGGFCAEISFSPDKRIIAVDSGTFIVRFWKFYSYPEMKPIGKPVLYYALPDMPGLRWFGKNEVLFNAIDTESKRICDYDPCGPVSVERLNLSNGQLSPLKQGSILCDWILLDLEDNKAVVGKRCQPTIEGWKESAFDGPWEKITIPLQQHATP